MSLITGPLLSAIIFLASLEVQRALPTSQQRQFQLNPQLTMNSLRIARVALRARPAAIKAPLQRRGYAEAVSDKVGTIIRSLCGSC